ncbi:AAA family ATPase (plasmid) [Vibrio sp. SS-MA-C1-2]|uniref:AAA family ATPase n=1 Tax=Vibrio sp. SS-MA-C1-2 TaxID=2908646 RepID=UPI001F41D9F0|nr:AAA family ATPase [Vibrio sp. SS-MA-C1-2]UJF20271.1 AAA family ATPase [Vibrio sp. SS-MA-C1-2]
MSDLNTNTTTVEQENAVIDYSETKTVMLRDVFKGFISPKNGMQVTIPKHTHPDVPRVNPNYMPDKDTLVSVIKWFFSPERPIFLHSCGPSGSGKTEFWLWFAAKTNWPVEFVSCNPTMRPEKMQGRWILKDGQTSFVHGPVSKAMSQGKLLILDEADTSSQDFIAKMHLPSEMNKPWMLEDTGELIYPNPNYRFVTTGNTPGCGDISGLYPACKRWSTAFRNRAGVLWFDYLSPADETKAIYTRYPKLKANKHSVKLIVKFANMMRDAMLGQSRRAEEKSSITVAFSTRLLMSWMYYLSIGGKAKPRESLEMIFLSGCEPKLRDDILMTADQAFNLPAGHFLDNEWGWYDDLKNAAKQNVQSTTDPVDPVDDEDLESLQFNLLRCQDNGSDKIWAGVVRGTTCFTIYGATGAAKYRMHKKEFNSESEANNYLNSKEREKLNKGYHATGATKSYTVAELII